MKNILRFTVLMASINLCFAQQQNLQTSFVTVSDAELAKHFDLSEKEIKKYQRYMALEGKYFYPTIDPVMVLGIIEGDPQRREAYAAKWLQAERRRVTEQVSFANLVAKTQMKIYGKEPLMNFNQLPWAEAETFNPDELMKGWKPPVLEDNSSQLQMQEAQPVTEGDLLSKTDIAPIDQVPTIEIGSENTEFMPGDEIWLVVDATACDRCFDRMEDFLALSALTPLRIYAMTPLADLEKWAVDAGVTDNQKITGFVTLKTVQDNIKDFGEFQGNIMVNQIYHARRGQVIREIGEGGL